MKKHICLMTGITLLICPFPLIAETVQGYIVSTCANPKNSHVTAMCNNASLNCGSSSTAVAPNSTYGVCGVFDVNGVTGKVLICFKDGTNSTDATICKNLSACGDDYYFSKEKLSLTTINVGGITTVSNYEFFKCCQTCGVTDWYDVTSGTTPYQRSDYNKCSTTGVCSVSSSTRPRFRCPENYYSQNGSKISGMVPTCLACGEKTGVVAAKSPVASGSITDCYIEPGVSLTDTSGNYTFTQKCNYSE